MHIADVTLFFAPHSGGVKRYLLAKHRFLTGQTGARHSLLVPGARAAEVSPGIFELPAPRIASGYRIPARPWLWRRKLCALKPDIIEVGDPYHLAWTALDAADRIGAATVAFAHSDMPRMLACRFGDRRQGRRYLLRRLYAFRSGDGAEPADRQSAAGGGSRTRRRAAARRRAISFIRAARFGLAQRAGIATARLLVFAGRMAREKQIPLLLDTFAKLGAPYHLLLIGGEERSRLSANVTLLPYEQDSMRLARVLASADALVHAGVHETFGMIVIEAMACGRPVIGLRAGAIPELIDDRVGLLADPRKPQALAEQSLRCTRDLTQWATRRRAERYTWDSAFTRLLKRYACLQHRMPWRIWIWKPRTRGHERPSLHRPARRCTGNLAAMFALVVDAARFGRSTADPARRAGLPRSRPD